jgi:hydrogenase/urease accessory protein HupE
MLRGGFVLALLAGLAVAGPAGAHPMPFSTLDVRLDGAALEVALTAHAFDWAHDLGVQPPERLMEPGDAAVRADALARLVGPRVKLFADGRALGGTWSAPEVIADRQALRLQLRPALAAAPARLQIEAVLFPYDRNHQTFVNLYEGGRLVRQAILDARQNSLEHFAGTAAGRLAVVRKFTGSGIHHILIGFDHIAFLIGLLLLGGTLRRLLVVVSAFTLGHSVTLSLAALGLVNVPARIVEPAIALSIVLVGADNLLARPGGRDARPLYALGFGLVHGFGFAGVLRETGLPAGALGWSLFSFNLGVEIGQLLVVAVVATALQALRARSAELGRRLTLAGSVAVAAAGAFWFIERIIFSGGIS